MDPNDLPDRVHVQALREALWKPGGRAALMVGAGMSRNARKLSSSVPEFPLWWEIARALGETLGPQTKNLDGPRLGQMYENVYGRARLDDLLLELIPDGKYEPGTPHETLMRLPWTDVFTVNYDTLLERTRQKVPERNYEVVETPADLTRTEQPRIVKLHGSFPARRPFIFTIEDFRRYPAEFAPFVNLVRQSAMENVLCLLGFSGDDPNFLQWAGWVRDQLGSTAPKMYLCGVFDLATPDRTYYQHMQVIPVDLGPLFPREHYGSADRYRTALEWLLEYLRAGEPADLSRWPHIQARTQARAPSRQQLEKPREQDEVQAREVLAHWGQERACYPGWRVCPESRRWGPSYESRRWFWYFTQPAGVQFLTAIPLPGRLDALREIAWRAEVCLIPLPQELCKVIVESLEAINPRPRLVQLPGGALTYETATERIDWDVILEAWVALAFALVRHAWQIQDARLHKCWMDRLERVVDTRSEWRARWWYEKCWHHLARLEFREALGVARAWPQDTSVPWWEAKRALVLGEFDDATAASELMASSLLRVQRGRDRGRVDYQSLSEEGWILRMQEELDGYAWGASVDGSHWRTSWDARMVRGRRLRELTRDHCNPWDDIQDRDRASLEESASGETTTRSFDPGYASRRFRSAHPNDSHWALACTIHDSSLRPSGSDGFLAALRRMWLESPRLALGLVMRAGASDKLTEGEPLAGLVGRGAVARMTLGKVEELYDWLSAVLRDALSDRGNKTISDNHSRGGDRRIQGAAEVLSRLAFRLDERRLADLMKLTCEMYLLPVCHDDIALHRPIENMFERTYGAASPKLLRSSVPALLALPVVGEVGCNVRFDQSWPDPFQDLSLAGLPALLPPEMDECAPSVDRLIGLLRGGHSEARRRACARLLELAYWRALTQDQLRSFGGAIQRTEQDYPEHSGVRPWVLLDLPTWKPEQARQAIMHHLCDGVLEPRAWVDHVETTTVHLAEQVDAGWPRLRWTQEEAAALLTHLTSLWQHAGREQWLRRDPDLVRRFCDTLSSAIVPFLDSSDPRSLVQVRTFVDAIREEGHSSECAWPALVLLGGAKPDEAAQSLYRAFFSNSRSRVHDAAFSLVTWVDLGQAHRTQPPPTWLVDAVVACAESGRQPGLTHVLDALVALLQRKEPALDDRHIVALTRAADSLLETVALENMQDDGTWNDDLQWDGDERVAVLGEVSSLSSALWALHVRRGIPIPPAIGRWRAYAAKHPLPEIRNPWAVVGSEDGGDGGVPPAPPPSAA